MPCLFNNSVNCHQGFSTGLKARANLPRERDDTAVSRKDVQQNRTRQWSFSDIEGNSTNKCIYALSYLVCKHGDPQSINAKLSQPIIPIGIVAYAFTLLWDNLCRKRCIQNQSIAIFSCRGLLHHKGKIPFVCIISG